MNGSLGRLTAVVAIVAGGAFNAAILPHSDAVARPSTAVHGGTHTNIYVMPWRGGRPIRITANGEGGEDHLAYDPSWSPDGHRIVFTEVRCHSCTSEIHVVAARPVHGNWLRRTLAHGFRPRWSPDGKKIAFIGTSGGIYVMNSDGSRRRLIVKHGLANDGPSWSPDSKSIVFTEQATASSWRIYRIRADGTGLRPLPTGDGSVVDAAWSPDGRTIAFARQSRLWQIYSMTARGSQRRKLSDGRASDSFPSWSPNGRMLAFVRQQGNNTSIFTMTRRGRNVRRLTQGARAVEPAWSPRGDKIAFAADLS